MASKRPQEPSGEKIYTEDVNLGASTFPPQYLSPTVHPYTCSYTLESAQNVCSVPDTQYEYKQRNCYQGFQMVKPQTEHMCPLPQETKSLAKKKTSDESKFNSKKAGGALSSDIKSDGYHKRTDKKSRIIEKCGSASKSGLAFTRLDFPELHGSENSGVSEIPKQSTWGPLRPTTPNISLLKEVEEPPEVLLKGEIEVKNKNPSESIADNAANSSSSCTRELSWTPMGYVIRQKLSPELSSAPKNVTSMINLKTIASSADSKTISVASSEVLSSDPSYNKEKNTVHPTKKSKALQDGSPEQNEISRKNKKKKEKSKLKCEVLTVQEPPRIEDAEEFPILAVASARRSKVESTKFQPMQQPQNNFKNSGKKSEIPFQLDLGRMLTALEKKQNSPNAKLSSKPLVFTVGAVPVLSKDASAGMKNHHLNQAQGPHNPLDSSAPLQKKGKQRETPKAKKPTSLKKIILKERQERKQQRLQENAANDVQEVASTGEHQPVLPANSSGETEGSVLSTFTEESELEEQLRTEPRSDTEACHLGLDSISFPKIHSRRFRDYCSQMLSKEVDACVTDLLKELVRFQDRMYQKDPIKAKTKRRLVLGLREVLKHLKLKKLKCVIISPNCEKIQSKGGLDDTLHTIIDYACEQNIPFVFALNRRALGRSLNKAVPVSVVGIFSYDGAQDQFHKMVKLTMAARQQYKTMLENVCQEVDQEPGAHSPPMGCPAAPEKEEPHYIEIWRKHLKAYNQCPQELEESLGASTSQMMNLKL